MASSSGERQKIIALKKVRKRVVSVEAQTRTNVEKITVPHPT